jgi:CDP-4-dehydro-6-deoxyglucose reductase
VHETVVRHYPDLSGYEVYASGPPPMIEAGQAAFREHRLPEAHFHFDSFEFNH